ncbi:hypothetical protein QVD99_000059, partial [Batrachochytrium dendrobatidis]
YTIRLSIRLVITGDLRLIRPFGWDTTESDLRYVDNLRWYYEAAKVDLGSSTRRGGDPPFLYN